MKNQKKEKLNKNILTLEKEILFVESFVRSVEFIGKLKATKVPLNTLFYLGPSKAEKIKYFHRGWKGSFEKYFGFKNNNPFLLKDKKSNLDLSDPRLESIALISHEYFDVKENIWFRENDHIKYIKKDSGYEKAKAFSQFNINGIGIGIIDGKGNFSLTPKWSEKNIIEINKTYVYLYYQGEYDYYDFGIIPNLYTAHFFKNYGFHKEINLINEEEFSGIDSNNLCLEELNIRDLRRKTRNG